MALWEKRKLSLAVSAALATGIGTVPAEEQPRAIEEVIVTATKRAESTQDIAVSVSALQGDDLDALRISNFDDYIKHLPNVVMMGVGPGQSEIYIRGAATEQSKNTIASVQGSSPATALYLDEQPVSFGGRNLDIYATDLNRIEVLPGPQGTLFGASSQSGTVRLITNRPDTTAFAAGVDVGAATTKGGDLSNSQEAFVNIPLSDQAAVRIVGYRDNQAGWIDNILNDPDNGGFSPVIDLLNRNDISAAPIHPDSPFEAANNSALVEDDFNDADYLGGRLSLVYDLNEDWSLLAQHVQQSLETDGVFAYDPNLDGTTSTNRFTMDSTDDDFGLTMLTVEGRLGLLDLIYAGGYLDREVEAYVDYTDYTNGGGYQVYYLCSSIRDFGGDGFVGRGGSVGLSECHDPEAQYRESTENTRMTHEFRISTPQENRGRLTAGLFYDDQKTKGIGAFEDAATRDDGDGAWPALALIGDVGEGTNSPATPYNPGVSFINDYSRDIEQIAVFAHAEFDISNKVTASFGARWYDLDFGFKGASSFSFGCKFSATELCDSSVARGGADPTSLTSGNNVTARLRALGVGTLDALMTAGRENCRPEVRDSSACRGGLFSRGMDFSAAESLYADIQNGSFNIDDLNDDGIFNESDVILRASLDWRLNDDLLLFATYGQGFRHGVTNRNAGVTARNSRGLAAYDGYRVPAIAETDELENWELGMKGDFLDNSLRLNATAYYSAISDLQVSRFDPVNVAFLVFIENVGDAEIFGLDADFLWLPTPNLTLSGAVGFIDTEITRINAQLEEISVPEGSELPFSPEFSASLRVRYDFFALFDGATNAYVSTSLSYSGSSKSGIAGSAHFVEDTLVRSRGRGSGLKIADEGGAFVGGNCGTYDSPITCKNGRYIQDSHVLLDMAVGFERDNWSAELFVDNLADKRAELHIDTLQYVPKVVTNRPRTIGLRLSYDFKE